jgi:hypothetical protein
MLTTNKKIRPILLFILVIASTTLFSCKSDIEEVSTPTPNDSDISTETQFNRIQDGTDSTRVTIGSEPETEYTPTPEEEAAIEKRLRELQTDDFVTVD